MKRLPLIVFTLGLAAMMIIGGCNRNVKKIEDEVLKEELKKAPKWVLSGDEDELFSAVGAARIGKGGFQFARTEAMSQGRGELARQLAVKVKSLVNSFVQQTGIGDEQTLDSFSKQVSKLVTDETLSGSRQKDIWVSPGSEVYVLMVLDQAAVEASLKRQVVDGFRQNSAQWQAFQAKNGNAELDREIEKAFSR
jgi:hypothetical protein